MPRSHWKLHTNATTKASAAKIISRCLKLIGRPPIEMETVNHPKGVYMTSLQIYHHDQLSWPEIVIEVIGFGQSLGDTWRLQGQITSYPNAVLDIENHNSHIVVPGLLWATWEILNEQNS